MHNSIPSQTTRSPVVEEALKNSGRSPEELLPVLRSAHGVTGSLDSPLLTEVAREMKIPAHSVSGVASFYSLLADIPPGKKVVRLCDGVVCWLHGARQVRQQLEQQPEVQRDCVILRSSCLGLCDRAPSALVDGHACGHVSQEQISCLSETPETGQFPLPCSQEPRPGEIRLLLERAGKIDPRSLDEAQEAGAYAGLTRALGLSRQQVVSEVEESGLRGRGGAGFPTARKWKLVSEASGDPILICNADESEPLMFKDRTLIDADPHGVLEGMAIAAYAIGAREGIIYIRGEYEPQAQLLEHAIQQAVAKGVLGDDIAGSGFSFHVHVHRGAGAYICGEETALLESLEGKRGEPRVRPPYPAQAGFQGRPTAGQNVETLATVAAVLRMGASRYRAIGHRHTPGTRLFTLLGHIQNPGLVEVPFGLTLRQLIDELGGGMKPGSSFQFALTGGAAGTFAGEAQLDVPLDYGCEAHGLTMGSGGFLICDETVSPVALLKELMHFFEMESCGKCTPCRIGTSQARGILEKLLCGQAKRADLNELIPLVDTLHISFCGLGTSAASPLSSAWRLFHTKFEELLK